MKVLRRLLIPIITLIIWNHCLADNLQITVYANSQPIQIAIPENATSNTIQRLIVERVRRTIIDLAIQKSKIYVSQEILSQCMDLYVVAGGENPTNFVNTIAEKSKTTIQALRRVVIDHEDKNNVYDQYLSGVMSRPEWEAWLKSNDSPEKIDKLESLVPHSVADLKHFSQDSLRKDIEMWLLFQKITKGVSPTSEEIQLFYKKEYPAGTPSFLEVQSEIKVKMTRQLIDACFNRWWQAQLAENKTEVPTEYQAVNELIKIKPNLPFLPDSITAILEKIN